MDMRTLAQLYLKDRMRHSEFESRVLSMIRIKRILEKSNPHAGDALLKEVRRIHNDVVRYAG